MKRIFFIFLCLASFQLTMAGVHPRLFFSPSDTIAIRIKANTPQTTTNELWNLLKVRQADHYSTLSGRGQLLILNNDPNKPNPGEWPNLYSLAFAYMMTRNSLYLTRTRDIIFGYPGQDGLLAQPFVAQGDSRVLTLSLVTDLLWDSFTSTERNQILQVVLNDIRHEPDGLRAELTRPALIHENNHKGRKAGALLPAAIVFKDDPLYPEANDDIQLVRNQILLDQDSYVVRMFDPEGVYNEGTYYGPVSLHHLIPMMHELSRLDGIDYFQQEPFRSRLQKNSSWYAQEILPAPRNPLSGGNLNIGRYLNTINDSYTGFYNSGGLLSGLLLLGGAYNDSLATWVFNNTIQSVSNILIPGSETAEYWQRHAPSYTLVESIVLYHDMIPQEPITLLSKSKYYKERGLVYVHTSSNAWADQSDIQFSFEGSPAINPSTGFFSIKHDQPDKNSFTISAFGEDFIMDPGYIAKWPEDQNTILIDNKGEAIASYFDQYNVEQADWPERQGRIVTFCTSSSFDFIHGDAKAAYDQLYMNDVNGSTVIVSNPNDPMFLAPHTRAYLNPVQKADRYVLSTRAAPGTLHTFVIGDDIQKDGQLRSYKWLFHTEGYNSVSGTNPRIISANGKQLKIWYTSQGTTSVSSTPTTYSSGASSLDSDSTKVISSSSIQDNRNEINTNAINPFFHIVMIPYETSDSYPIVTNPTVSNGSCFKLAWNSDYEDYSVLKHTAAVTSSFVSTDAKLTQIRKQVSSGLPVQFAMGEGSQLTFESRELTNLYGIQGSVMREGSNVFLNGSIAHFRVYAPSAASVKLNGGSIQFHQIGDYVESHVASTPIINGWQMLSVPVVVPNFLRTVVWPTATTEASEFTQDSGYVVRTTLKNGPGYWIRFGAVQNVVTSGGYIEKDTVHVFPGWNLIGSITDDIPISNVCLYPNGNTFMSVFFTYKNGYVPVQSIAPGIGHWIKVQQNGDVVFNHVLEQSCNPLPLVEEDGLDHFVITDAQGQKQDLFVANLDNNPSLGELDLSMPPPFPEAEFDARFDAGEYIKTVSPDSGIVELVINVEAEAYPVTVNWDLNPENGIEYSINTGGMGKQMGSNRLTRLGSNIMTSSSGGKFRLNAQVGHGTKDVLPTKYLLAQNYPNPFNPLTIIKYDLPADQYVTLKVYDVLGREVYTLVDDNVIAGYQQVSFNANQYSSGVYFYKITAGNFVQTKKLLLLK